MEITFSKLIHLNNPNIIDIRSNEKYNNNHVPGSINIPYNLLVSNPQKFLNKVDTYYLYCQKGITSKICVNILRSFGFNVVSVIGGYEEYILNNI